MQPPLVTFTVRDFSAALMLAICASGRRTFPVGDAYHRAFFDVVVSVNMPIEDVRWVRIDPVFGRVPQATEMISNAVHDLLIEIDDVARVAHVRVKPEQARRELEEQYPAHAKAFLRIAQHFLDELAEASCSPSGTA